MEWLTQYWSKRSCWRGTSSALVCLVLLSTAEMRKVERWQILEEADPSYTIPARSFARVFREAPVLGYVTPWHSRGNDLVEEFNFKFDIVSPVWYTVHVENGVGSHSLYTIQGGPSREEDVSWLQKIQQGHDSNGMERNAARVSPRFMLDNWSQEDYKELFLNASKWDMLAMAIFDKANEMSFDGIVFEAAMTPILHQQLTPLSQLLRAANKTMTLVLPPIRTPLALGGAEFAQPFEAQNAEVLRSIPELSTIADYFSIMTYDMAGPGGRVVNVDRDRFPVGSPLASAKHGSLREPWPNTSRDWVLENLEAFYSASKQISGMNDISGQQSLDTPTSTWPKFLMGLPLYGYTYPIRWSDRGVPVDGKKQASSKAEPLLRAAGHAITTLEIIELLEKHETEIEESDESEFFFDYQEDDGDWRVFMPTSAGIERIINGIIEFTEDEMLPASTFGVALWEVGQATKELLTVL